MNNLDNYILVIIMFLILVVSVCYYKVNENFSCYKRKVNGLYAGIDDNSREYWLNNNDLNNKITNILEQILDELNNKIGSRFSLNGIDTIKTEELPNNKNRYIVDFFVHEYTHRETKRFITSIIVCCNYVQVESLNLSNALNAKVDNFPVFKDSNLILTDDNLKQNSNHLFGRNDSKLEFSKIKEKHIKSEPCHLEFQKWILPLSISEANMNKQSLYPCRIQSTEWDSDGVNYTQEGSSNCIGIKSDNSPINIQPYQNPTVNRLETEENGYSWLFDLSKGISGFPHGSSNGK